jgi:hypothetical protein
MAMSFQGIWPACEDGKFQSCANRPLLCDKCTRRHGYTALLRDDDSKDYYVKSSGSTYAAFKKR